MRETRSEIVKTDALVLRTLKYSESSMIVTFYTRALGRMAGIVKGARKPGSRAGSALQPMSCVSVVLYKKEGREIQTVSQCDRLRRFPRLTSTLERMAPGMAVVEFLNNVAHEEEQNIPLFDLAVDSLAAIDASEKNFSNMFIYFEIAAAHILGFEAGFSACVSCRRPLPGEEGGRRTIGFHIEKGGPVCDACRPPAGMLAEVEPAVLRAAAAIAGAGGPAAASGVRTEPGVAERIENLVWSFLAAHVSGIRTLRSKSVFSQVMQQS